MNQASEGTREADLDLILFRAGGVRFGARAGEVVSALALGGADSGELLWFHDAMGYLGDPVAYRNPVVLALRADARRVVVDGLEGPVQVSLDAVRPLPAVIEPRVLHRGLWAVALLGEALVLLVDLHRLATAPQPALCPQGTISS